MKATIDVRDRAEADRIKTALQDETVRACVNVMGALLPLSPRGRKTVLRFAGEQLDPYDPPPEAQS